MQLDNNFAFSNTERDLVLHKGKQNLLYTIPTNPECQRAREFMLRRGVAFEEIDVTKSADGLEQLLKMAKAAVVPFLKTGERTVAGFDEKKYAFALGI